MKPRPKKKIRRDVDGTKIVLAPSGDDVRKRGRKPDKWVGVFEEGQAKFGHKMFHVATFRGRERAYRVRKEMVDGKLEIPGGGEKWELHVVVRKCRGGERAHDG